MAGREVALYRWPTTIGGWKTIEKSDGSMALKYKESVTGDAIWPEILATPTWHPATGIPRAWCLRHIQRSDPARGTRGGRGANGGGVV